jgi:hypothetical protein
MCKALDNMISKIKAKLCSKKPTAPTDAPKAEKPN